MLTLKVPHILVTLWRKMQMKEYAQLGIRLQLPTMALFFLKWFLKQIALQWAKTRTLTWRISSPCEGVKLWAVRSVWEIDNLLNDRQAGLTLDWFRKYLADFSIFKRNIWHFLKLQITSLVSLVRLLLLLDRAATWLLAIEVCLSQKSV